MQNNLGSMIKRYDLSGINVIAGDIITAVQEYTMRITSKKCMQCQ